jgi:hypothetical protein
VSPAVGAVLHQGEATQLTEGLVSRKAFSRNNGKLGQIRRMKEMPGRGYILSKDLVDRNRMVVLI